MNELLLGLTVVFSWWNTFMIILLIRAVSKLEKAK